MDLEARVRGALEAHPQVRAVRLVGSRAAGTPGSLSDWDFAVDAANFDAVARDLPRLVAPLEPLAGQWDRYSEIECYLVMLPRAVKLDLLFPDRPHVDPPAWEASPETLPAIDAHFWDWILWIAQKAERAEPRAVAGLLARQHRLLLAPLGVERPPRSVGAALGAYLDARGRREREYGFAVDRRLGEEVLNRLARHGHVPPPDVRLPNQPHGVPRDP